MKETLDMVTPLVGDPDRFHTLADLERMLMALPRLPTDRCRVALMVRRVQEGEREILDRMVLAPGEGVPGDRWIRKPQPNPETQLAVMQKDVAELIANGQPLTLFGDNLFLELDLSFTNLPPGSRLRAGSAILEVTSTAHTPCKKFQVRFGEDAVRFVSNPELGHRKLRGIYMRPVEMGEIRTGDLVEVISRVPVIAELKKMHV
ncbi:MAG: MOSC domain-containing protein [Candidatus Latescibacteria bacterium]|nr:MOSC domain-containing protein [Candidatus Latescibacterota bacterium]